MPLIYLHRSRDDRRVVESRDAAQRLLAEGYAATSEANYLAGWREQDLATLRQLTAAAAARQERKRGIYPAPSNPYEVTQ